MPEYKKLYRSENKMIAGVCGGIAQYFGIYPTLVRLAYAMLTVFFAILPGIIFYILCWIIIPNERP